jgi:hypothetical protein
MRLSSCPTVSRAANQWAPGECKHCFHEYQLFSVAHMAGPKPEMTSQIESSTSVQVVLSTRRKFYCMRSLPNELISSAKGLN